MSFFYWLSKFSNEAILIEVFCIALIGVLYFGYLILSRRKYGAAKRQIPDHIVKAYLLQQIAQVEGFKNQLFGENFKFTGQGAAGPTIQIIEQVAAPRSAESTAAMMSSGAGAVAGGASSADLSALQGELSLSRLKQEDLQKNLNSLAQEKAALEAKLAEAQKGGGAAAAAGGGGDKALQEKLSQLESKLSEYEVIEDDLANLKKFMQENKQLKAQIEALKAGGASAAPVASAPAPQAAAAPVPEAPAAPEPAPLAAAPEPKQEIAKAEEKASEQKASDALADKIEENIAAPASSGASAVDPAAVAAVQTAPPVMEAAPKAADAPVVTPPEPPKQDKSDADLLNEFERMLSS